MTVAILLLACLVLAGAVVALAVALREVRERVVALETSAVRSPGFETGASAPSSTNEAPCASRRSRSDRHETR